MSLHGFTNLPFKSDGNMALHAPMPIMRAVFCMGLLSTLGFGSVESSGEFIFGEPVVARQMTEGPAGLTGTLALYFMLDGVNTTLQLPHLEAGEGYTEGPLATLPFGRAWLFFGGGSGGINLAWENESGESLLAQLSLSHLKGGQIYQLAIAWDLKNGMLRMWLNGVEQGDLMHARAAVEMRPAQLIDTITLGGDLTFGGKVVARVGIAEAIAYDRILSEAEIQQHAARRPLKPLSGEARTLFREPMRTDGLQMKLVYETSFNGDELWQHERDLIDGEGLRVDLPKAGAWILEGDSIERQTTAQGVHFVSQSPDSVRDGAWVFWLNRELPENFLIEYAFTPERSDRGLNILFFNATGSGNSSIFDPSQPIRQARFRPYIVGTIDNYHISPWATDGTTPRRTANLRKNSGFRLLAAGNDRIYQPGSKTHLVRLKKVGRHIELESDGIVALRHEDEGNVYGPILTGGIAGLRFMAHTGSATVHFFRIYSLAETQNIK